METEKVCVNLSAAELGKLDLLVEQGVFVNRSDVVRAALRREFDCHDWESLIDRGLGGQPRDKLGQVGIGLFVLRRVDLEQAVDRNERLNLFCAGILMITPDVTPDLADRAIGRIRLLGSLRAPKPVVDRIGDRLHRGRGK